MPIRTALKHMLHPAMTKRLILIEGGRRTKNMGLGAYDTDTYYRVYIVVLPNAPD